MLSATFGGFLLELSLTRILIPEKAFVAVLSDCWASSKAAWLSSVTVLRNTVKDVMGDATTKDCKMNRLSMHGCIMASKSVVSPAMLK